MGETQKQKIQICDECPYMEINGEGTVFEGERNDRYCTLLQSLVRPHLSSSCPDNRW